MRVALGSIFPTNSRPMMHPMFVGGTARFERALVNCSEPFRDTFRCVVVGPNEARSTRQRKVLKQPITGRPRSFGREALAPKRSVERIDDLRFRPVERGEDADATD